MAQQVASSLGQPSQAAASRDSSPIAFKQHLLASLNDECEIMNMLSMQEWDKIAVCQFQGIEYVLICDPEPLPRLRYPELDDEIIYCFYQFKYRPDKRSQDLKAFNSTLPKHPAAAQLDGDIFLPIGSIHDPFRTSEAGYVCMLNISTNPISMWAVYDYFHDDTKIICEYQPLTRATSVMWGSDLFLLYEDIKDWNPNSGSVASWKPPGKEMHLLGNMLRGHTIFPPEDLLDAVTQDQDSNNAVEEDDGNQHAAESAGGSAA